MRIGKALGSLVVLFLSSALVSCSKPAEPVSDPAEAESVAQPNPSHLENAVAEVDAANENSTPVPPAPSPTATKPANPEIEARQKAILAALERSPTDMQRLLEGIREKYALDRLDDPRMQLAELLKRYEAGDRSVLMDLGLFVAYGDPSIIDPVQAKAFFEEAAADGEARALAELGRLYLTGVGMDRDPAAARDYFEQAMAAGDPDGAFLLGMGYRNGLFGEAEEATGIDYLTTAASMGHLAAANALFDLSSRAAWEMGKGKPAAERRTLFLERLGGNPEMEQWLMRGAEQGDLASLLNLAKFYKAADAIDKAVPVLQTAAELGSFDALKSLMDLSARKFRDAEYRESFKALLLPHIDANGDAKSEALFRMALLEAMDGPRSIEEVRRLLSEASSARYHKAWVALSKMDEGVIPPRAIIDSLKMSEEDAYVQWTRRKELEMPPEDANGNVQEKRPDDVAPVLTKIARPSYPPELMAEAMSGQVVIDVVIDESGKPVRSSIVESTHPAFEAPALEAAKEMEFTPARRGGKPVAIKVRVPIYFNPAR